MGKNQRIRKHNKVEMNLAEKQAVQERKKDRVGPTVKLTKKLVLAVFCTFILLYGGTQVDKHLNNIIAGIKNIEQAHQNK
jgi:hypothetical protein